MEVSHERGTTGDSQFKGTKGTKGVQLATASSKVSDMCRDDVPVLALRYKGGMASGFARDGVRDF